MPLQSSGAISISQINSEFGRGNNLNSYRGTTWYTAAGGSGTFSSGAISMSEFYSKQATSPSGSFDPDGSTSSSSRTLVDDYGEQSSASVTITCTQSATWTYSRVTGTLGSANVTSGSSATSITFTLGLGANFRYSTWNLDGTSGSTTRYWLIELTTDQGDCPLCCFTPDTLITMADGSFKPIGEIQAGDMILTRDEATGINILTNVSNVITRVDRQMYEIKFANDTSLRASEDHPLYVVGKGWAAIAVQEEYKDLDKVHQLSLGDTVVCADGTLTTVVGIEPIDFLGTVYTLGNSRFYANGILVY